MPYFVPTTYHK